MAGADREHENCENAANRNFGKAGPQTRAGVGTEEPTHAERNPGPQSGATDSW